MEGLTEGRIVHYNAGCGHCQAAIIVKVWQGDIGCVNLYVFPDGSNDREVGATERDMVRWETSRVHGEEVSRWHWPTECSPSKAPEGK